MKVLLLDGYNLLYRSYHSSKRFSRGKDWGFTYQFFRSLRPIIEKFNPDVCYFVLEGYPKWRHEISGNYKVNRKPIQDNSFREEKKIIINILKESFPIFVVRHPDHECDDVIANLIWKNHDKDDCVVVSTDSDFIQLLKLDNVRLYNPIKKSYTSGPEYDYVQWKALRGDGADDIDGFKGVGDKTATTICVTPGRLKEFLNTEEKQEKFDKNVKLINFTSISDMYKIESSPVKSNWELIKESFNNFGFRTMISKDKTWDKYVNTFLTLES